VSENDKQYMGQNVHDIRVKKKGYTGVFGGVFTFTINLHATEYLQIIF
jgi:hypothetical protein